jgi:hypothetical protein
MLHIHFDRLAQAVAKGLKSAAEALKEAEAEEKKVANEPDKTSAKTCVTAHVFLVCCLSAFVFVLFDLLYF